MTWFYVQRTGGLYLGTFNHLAGTGYSGAASHQNEPGSEYLVEQGPIPRGAYEIGPPANTLTHGPFVLSLQPAPTNIMHGRAGFLIHGDRIAGPPGSASSGCIILDRDVREQVWDSLDHALCVVAEEYDVPNPAPEAA